MIMLSKEHLSSNNDDDEKCQRQAMISSSSSHLFFLFFFFLNNLFHPHHSIKSVDYFEMLTTYADTLSRQSHLGASIRRRRRRFIFSFE